MSALAQPTLLTPGKLLKRSLKSPLGFACFAHCEFRAAVAEPWTTHTEAFCPFKIFRWNVRYFPPYQSSSLLLEESLELMGLVSLFFNLHWPSCRGDGVNSTDPSFWGPAFSQAQICACSLELTTGSHSLHEARDSQLNAAKVTSGLVCRAGVLRSGLRRRRAAGWAVAQKPGTEGGSQLCFHAQPWLELTALWRRWGSWNECQDVYPKSLLSDFLRKATLVLKPRLRVLHFLMVLEILVWEDR